MKSPDEIRFENAEQRFSRQMAAALRNYADELKGCIATIEAGIEKINEMRERHAAERLQDDARYEEANRAQ